MGSQFFDRVKQNTATTGTGTVTLSTAVAHYQTLASAVTNALGAAGNADGLPVTLNIDDGNDWEVSTGTVGGTGTTVTRALVSSSTGSLLNLSGTATVVVGGCAADMANASLLDLLMFGNGEDGDVTVSGSVSLTRDMYYRNLTLSAGAAILTNGWRIYVSGILDLTAAPAAAINQDGKIGGNAASVAAGGAAGGSQTNNSFGNAGLNSAAGSAGPTGAGANAANGGSTAQITQVGGIGGKGGASGAGSNAGGTSPTQVTHPSGLMRITPWNMFGLNYFTNGSVSAGFGGNSGGNGATGGGDGTNRGGSTGGQGGGGGTVWVGARTISRGGSTAAGAIRCIGGNAGAGFAPAAGICGGSGGSGGGGGGWVALSYRFLTGAAATGCIDVTAGNGAAGTNGFGGNGVTTGIGGDGGSSGEGGKITIFNASTGTWVTSPGSYTPVVIGTAHAGATGGAGGTATTVQVNL